MELTRIPLSVVVTQWRLRRRAFYREFFEKTEICFLDSLPAKRRDTLGPQEQYSRTEISELDILHVECSIRLARALSRLQLCSRTRPPNWCRIRVREMCCVLI